MFLMMPTPKVSVASEKLQIWVATIDPDVVRETKRFLEDFETKYDVRVDFAVVTHVDYPMKLAAALAANELPDAMVGTPPHVLTLASKGYLRPVDYLIDEIGREDFFEVAITENQFNGKIYGIAQMNMGGPLTVWYRTDLFNKYGLDIPYTWDELLVLAEKLTRDGMYGITIPASKSALTNWQGYTYMRSNRASIWDRQGNLVLNSPETVETVEFFKKLYGNSPESVGFGWAEYKNTFWKGISAMCPYWNSLAPDMKEQGPDYWNKTSNFIFPSKTSEEYTGISITLDSWMIPKATEGKRLELTGELIKEFYQPEYYIPWLLGDPGDNVPVLRSIIRLGSDWWKHEVTRHFYREMLLGVYIMERNLASDWGLANYKHPRVGDVEGSRLLAEMFQDAVVTEKDTAEIVAETEAKIRKLL